MAGLFQGKVALVTGGSSGMGRATTLAFVREGARVVAADWNVEGGEETLQMVRRNGGEATFVKTDVSKAAEVEALVNRTIETYGRLDCAFNNAGVHGSGVYAAECTEEDWDSIVSINLKGVWLCMKYEIQWMSKHGGGAIVNTSSIMGLKGTPDDTEYVASKTAMVGITKSAALGYAEAGIRVNAVCPGMINTPMSKHRSEVGGLSREERIRREVPLGRMGTPEDVAEAVIWLCSDAASYITGIAMPIDGGLMAH